MHKARYLIVLILFLGISHALAAEELDRIFNKIDSLVKERRYVQALEELNWARMEIEKRNTVKLKSFFPDELAGFAGEEFQANSAMGFSSLERTYRNQSLSVRLSLAGSSSEVAGGLAAIGRMAAMMQQQNPGQETFRIDGRTASLQTDKPGRNAELNVFLESGSVLRFQMSNGSESETLRAMANAIDVKALDGYLSGTS